MIPLTQKPRLNGRKRVTAKLTGVKVNRKNRVAYAVARLSNGAEMSGIGLATSPRGDDPTGRYDALWDLAQLLSKYDIEVES